MCNDCCISQNMQIGVQIYTHVNMGILINNLNDITIILLLSVPWG